MRHPTGGTPRVVPALLVVLLAIAACGRDRSGPAAGAAKSAEGDAPERGGTAVIAEMTDMEKPMPLVWQSDLDGELVDVMYMGLTRGAWRGGRLVHLTSHDSPMALAWHWEYVGPDSAAIRFRMKSGLRWSDGRPITAHDVVWTFGAFADERTASPRHGDVQPIDSVVAENDSTVRFHFRRRTPDMLFVTSLPIAPRHLFEAAGPAGVRTHPAFERPERLVVSGPFKVGAWAPGAQITLVPNPHFSVPPRLDRIVIRVVREPTTRLVELTTGAADLVRSIAFDQVPDLRRRAPNLRFARVEDRYWEYVAYNPQRGAPFDDPELRRALGMAVDVPGTIRALRMEPFTTPAAGPYAPIFRELSGSVRPLAHDPDSARRVLERKGWRDTDGDSIREKDGKRLRFTLLTNAGNQRRADVSQVLQRQWRAVGADVRLQQLEYATFQARQMQKDFDALLGSWAVNLSPDISVAFETGAPFNIVSYSSARVDSLFARAKAAPTAAEADPLWRAAAEQIVRDQPYTWLYYYDIVVGMSERLRGVRVDTFGSYQNTWEWWIPRSRRTGAAAPPASGAGPDAGPAIPDTAKE